MYTSADGSRFAGDEIKAIDTVTGAVVASVAVRGPDGLAVDPETHTLYAYTDGKVAVLPRASLR